MRFLHSGQTGVSVAPKRVGIARHPYGWEKTNQPLQMVFQIKNN
jgi:hypothetical protein